VNGPQAVDTLLVGQPALLTTEEICTPMRVVRGAVLRRMKDQELPAISVGPPTGRRASTGTPREVHTESGGALPAHRQGGGERSMYKLRLAVLGPVLAVMVALVLLGFAQPQWIGPIALTVLAVLLIGLVVLFLLERSR
jgi:hypothetical protein